MVVKDKVGRKRYILVGITPSGINRSHLIHHINRSFGAYRRSERLPWEAEPPWLTVLEPDYAIFKCRHLDKELMVGFLNGLEVPGGDRGEWSRGRSRLRVIRVSGTIKKLKTKIINYGQEEHGQR